MAAAGMAGATLATAAPPAGAVPGETITVPVRCTAHRLYGDLQDLVPIWLKYLLDMLGSNIPGSGIPGTVDVPFEAQLQYKVRADNTHADLRSVTYTFGDPVISPLGVSVGVEGIGVDASQLAKWTLELMRNTHVGNMSNFNVIAPVKWSSADNLSPSGVLAAGVNGPALTVSNGQAVTVQAIPDLWLPDPQCTTTQTVAWSWK